MAIAMIWPRGRERITHTHKNTFIYMYAQKETKRAKWQNNNWLTEVGRSKRNGGNNFFFFKTNPFFSERGK